MLILPWQWQALRCHGSRFGVTGLLMHSTTTVCWDSSSHCSLTCHGLHIKRGPKPTWKSVCGCNIYFYGAAQRDRQSEEKRLLVTHWSPQLQSSYLYCPLMETVFPAARKTEGVKQMLVMHGILSVPVGAEWQSDGRQNWLPYSEWYFKLNSVSVN